MKPPHLDRVQLAAGEPNYLLDADCFGVEKVAQRLADIEVRARAAAALRESVEQPDDEVLDVTGTKEQSPSPLGLPCLRSDPTQLAVHRENQLVPDRVPRFRR